MCFQFETSKTLFLSFASDLPISNLKYKRLFPEQAFKFFEVQMQAQNYKLNNFNQKNQAAQEQLSLYFL